MCSGLNFINAQNLALDNLSKSDFSILTFNVQNLFDGVDNEQEYNEYKPPHWNTKDYQRRLVSIGKSLQGISPTPDIILLQEVEHQKVVEELHQYYLSKLLYVIVSDNQYSATENCLLSRYPIHEVRSHNLEYQFMGGNRYIMEVLLEYPTLDSELLQVILVHLKSQRNNENYQSDRIRAMQYKLITHIAKDEFPTIVVGDFNDTHPLTLLGQEAWVSYSLFAHNNTIKGSYYYKKQWEQLDHVLLDNRADAIFMNKELWVLDIAPFINKKDFPNKFNRSFKNFSGVSDHLPVLFMADDKQINTN